MRIIFLSVFIFCSQFFAFTQIKFDVLHYRYEIKLNDNNDTVYCKAEISIGLTSIFHQIQFDLTALNSKIEKFNQ